MFLPALVIAAAFALIYFLFAATFDTHQDDGVGGVVSVTIIGFVIAFLANWAYLWMSTPALNFGGVWGFVAVNTLIFAILAAIKNYIIHEDDENINPSTVLFIGFFVIWLIFGGIFGIGRPWGPQAYRLAKIAKVHPQPVGAYPQTDTEHISLMPEEAAEFKADQALTQGQGKSANLSTQYAVGKGTEQAIKNHLYWVFELQLDGWRNANRVGRIVPGYIVVDAENPEAQPQLKLGYKMKFTPGAPTGSSLKRLLWTHYKTYNIDEPTLEVNDDWQPYYTASLNRPAYTFGPSIPVSSIVVDPQTGRIRRYDISKTPPWVDRVYSAHVVKQLMNWWGNYGKGSKDTPRKFLGIGESSSNRYKVSGHPILVYSKDGDYSHPEWQVLLTSKKSDTAASYLALFDGRSTKARLYRVPGLQTEKAVLAAFENSAANIKKFEPTNLALHLIYGRLTWVAEYLPTDSNGPGSLQAIGLLAADNVSGANVQFGESKASVLTSYQLWLSSNLNGDNPNAQSTTESISGTVTRVSSVVISGNTTIYLVLEEDPGHVYRASVGDSLPELPFATDGAKVIMTYNDVGGNAPRTIVGYDDQGLALANK